MIQIYLLTLNECQVHFHGLKTYFDKHFRIRVNMRYQRPNTGQHVTMIHYHKMILHLQLSPIFR